MGFFVILKLFIFRFEDKKKKAQELIAYLNGANMVPQNLNKNNNYKINTDKIPEATAARIKAREAKATQTQIDRTRSASPVTAPRAGTPTRRNKAAPAA